jgi:hypothetical protein
LTTSARQDSLTAVTSPGDPAALADEVASKDPAVGLQAIVALRQLLEELERLHVDNARDQGWSWQDIASALRVTKQSVHEKHAARRKAQDEED